MKTRTTGKKARSIKYRFLFFAMLIQLGAPALYAGSQIGKGGVPSYADLQVYCESAVGILIRAKSIAFEQFQDGDLMGAKNSLMMGLQEALNSYGALPDYSVSLTRTAIARGLALDEAFQGGCFFDSNHSCFHLELRTALYLLDKYYSYILNTIAPLDRSYYMPYRTEYTHCRDHHCLPREFGEAFFVAYRKAAAALLNFYNGQLDRSGLPNALAKDVYELQVAERVFAWAAEDLNQDLWRRSFACVVQELSDASKDLADYNIGNTFRFKNSPRAVGFARRLAQKTARELTLTGSGCITSP